MSPSPQSPTETEEESTEEAGEDESQETSRYIYTHYCCLHKYSQIKCGSAAHHLKDGYLLVIQSILTGGEYNHVLLLSETLIV